MKLCPSCKKEKPFEDYWKGQSYCIPCQKHKQKTSWNSRTSKKRLEQHMRYKYGITPEDFLCRWEKQDGKCCICFCALPDLLTYEGKRRGYAIDHNHETNEFRGILCLECNSLLGMAGDNIEILQSAINYLNKQGSYKRKNNMAVSKKGKK